MAQKLKKGDQVIVLTGKDKGKKGEITQFFPSLNKALVSGVNVVKRHVKPSQSDPEGGIKEIEAKIDASNLSLIDPKDDRATRVGFKFLKDGQKVRYAKRSGETIE